MNPRTVEELRQSGLAVDVVPRSDVVVVTDPGGRQLLFAGSPLSESGDTPEVYAPCRRVGGERVFARSGETLLVFRRALWRRLEGEFDPDDAESVRRRMSDPGEAARDGAAPADLVVAAAPEGAAGSVGRWALWFCRPGGARIRPIAFLGGESTFTIQRTSFRDQAGEPLAGAVMLGLRDLRQEAAVPKGPEIDVVAGEAP